MLGLLTARWTSYYENDKQTNRQAGNQTDRETYTNMSNAYEATSVGLHANAAYWYPLYTFIFTLVVLLSKRYYRKICHTFFGQRLSRLPNLAPEEFKKSKSDLWPKKVVHHCIKGISQAVVGLRVIVIPECLERTRARAYSWAAAVQSLWSTRTGSIREVWCTRWINRHISYGTCLYANL